MLMITLHIVVLSCQVVQFVKAPLHSRTLRRFTYLLTYTDDQREIYYNIYGLHRKLVTSTNNPTLFLTLKAYAIFV